MKNVLSIFESRINDIFARSSTGSAPITFKKLAKKTIREMENETFVIDGVDTAPALYTVLVSADDDRTMRPFYANITAEVSSLVEAQAKKRGYTFVGQPLVRFMIDPSLKPGRYAVFAENVDPLTLARLREEENAFLGIESQPTPQPEVPDVSTASDAEEDGFTIIPEDSLPYEEQSEQAAPPAPAEEAVEEPAMAQEEPAEEPAPQEAAPATEQEQDQAEEPAPSPADIPSDPQPEPAAEAEPKAQPEAVPAEADAPQPQPEGAPAHGEAPAPHHAEAQHAARTQEKAPKAPSCTLTDQQTGRVYTITSERTPIGREHVPGGIVLRDPNVSRRHAELTYNGTEWHIRDLNSTNGTLVNDIDVEECALRNGDVLTIGLINLVFRER